MMPSVLLPHDDETIHSYIFRICMVYGIEHLSNVTHKNGEWNSSLRLNKYVKSLFLNLHDQHLIDLMRNTGWANKQCGVFDDPTSYMGILNKLVNHSDESNNSRKGQPIKYCIHCIRDSIFNHGYGYFKSDWYLDFGNFCEVHKVALTYTACKTKSQSLVALKQIIKGTTPDGAYCSSYYNPEYKTWNVKEPFYSSTSSRMLQNQSGQFIQISSCLKNNIKKWLLVEMYDFPIEVARAANYSSSASMMPINTNYVFKDYVLRKVIIALYQTQFKPFMMFWHNFAIEHRVYCGALNKKDISENIYIYDDSKNCQRCLDFRCPANLSIQYFHNSHALTKQCFDDYYKLTRHFEKQKHYQVYYNSRDNISKLTSKDKIEILSK